MLPLSRVHPSILHRSIESAFINKMDDNVDHANEKAREKYLFHQAQSNTYMILKSIQSLWCQCHFAYASKECRHIDHNLNHVTWQFRSPQCNRKKLLHQYMVVMTLET
jgi:hypothetical protein